MNNTIAISRTRNVIYKQNAHLISRFPIPSFSRSSNCGFVCDEDGDGRQRSNRRQNQGDSRQQRAQTRGPRPADGNRMIWQRVRP